MSKITQGRVETTLADVQWAKAVSLTRATFEESTREFAFFNHGLIMTAGGLTFDPLLELIAQSPAQQPLRVIPIAFNQPLFKGIGAGSDGLPYDTTLFAVERTQLENVASWLRNITIVNRNRKSLAYVTSRVIRVVDPIALGRSALLPARLPTGLVHVFELRSTLWSLTFQQDVQTPHSVASVRVGGPDPHALTLAKNIFAANDPFTELQEEASYVRIARSDIS
jgi:hypothetical protein